MRVIKVLYPENAVEWSETFDGIDVEGKGFIGYDPKKDLFFSMTVHNSPGNYDFLLGRFEPAEDTIIFEPAHLPSGGQPFKSVFHLVASDRFTFTAILKSENDEWSEAWVAVFERQSD